MSAPSTRPLCVAHRGNTGFTPENTLVSFGEAIRLGAEMIEFDIRNTADGALLIMHDPSVDRTTDGTGAVDELTLAQIRQLDAGSKCGPQFTGEKVPLFAKVLELLAPMNVQLNVQIYSEPQFDETIFAMLAEARLFQRSIIPLYGEERIRLIQKKYPDSQPMLMDYRNLDDNGATYIRKTVELGLEFTQPICRHMNPEFIARLHENGLKGNVFYADSEADIRRYAALGIDGILTNDLRAWHRAWETDKN